MNRIVITFLALFIGINLFSQEKRLDKLEMFYDQEHYKVVLKNANKLLDNPDYDYTVVPTFYKSLALFQMNQNPSFRRKKRNRNSLNEAVDLWEKFLREDDGAKVYNAHIHEIVDLKQDLILWREDLRNQNEDDLVAFLNEFLNKHFNQVDDIDDGPSQEIANVPTETEIDAGSSSKKRKELIKYSKTLLGIKYRYGGTDKKGFDCSGFTGYVYKRFEIALPRRAVDQYQKSNKIKLKEAKPGDLVFFSNGGGVNHVGIIVSNKNGHPVMIHASTSQGITETDIMSNSYWKPRLKYIGRYLD